MKIHGFWKITCFVTAFIFLCTNTFAQITPKQTQAPPLPASKSAALSLDIPSTLGKIDTHYRGDPSKPFVALIQDAHGISNAQIHNQKIIRHLLKNKGFRLVLFEGAQKKLDPTLLKAFPNQKLKEQVLLSYLKRGELSGVGLSSIINPEPAIYQGIEDWKLYEKNYTAYLKANRIEKTAFEHLRKLENDFHQKRKKVFASSLLKFHSLTERFYNEEIELSVFLSHLMDPTDPPLDQVSFLETLEDGSAFFKEIDSLIEKREEKLASTHEEKELLHDFKILRHLKKLVSLELIRGEYLELKETYPSFQKRHPIEALHKTLQPAFDFYKKALKRDEALFQNAIKALHKNKVQKTLLIAGGFHREGLEKRLKDNGFSFAVITPKIQNLEEIQNYENVMRGRVSYQKYLGTSFYDAFMQHITRKLASSMPRAAFRRSLKTWRDEIIRDLAKRKRLQDAYHYTRYLDVLPSLMSHEIPQEVKALSKKEILTHVHQELASFKERTLQKLPTPLFSLASFEVLEPHIRFHSPELKAAFQNTFKDKPLKTTRSESRVSSETSEKPNPPQAATPPKSFREKWIPFYSFFKTKASSKAFIIVSLAFLMTLITFIVGSTLIGFEIASSGYWNATYVLFLMIMLTASMTGTAEILFLQIIMFFQSPQNEEKPPPEISDEAYPTVTVVIPVRNEPLEVVEETLESVRAMNYPEGKLKILIVDNSDTLDSEGNPLVNNAYEQLEAKIGSSSSTTLIHREGTEGYKSGNLNLALQHIETDYILQLDADSHVAPETLQLVMPEFVHHETSRTPEGPRLAYVQIALGVHNKNESLLTWTLGTLHSIVELFWRPIRKGYRFTSSFGHHFIVATEAVHDAGGFPVDIGVAEDTDLAVGIRMVRNEADSAKWTGKRVDYHRLDEGVPNSFEGLKTQRWRWIFGNSRILIKRFKEILNSPMTWYEKYALLFDLGIFFLSAIIIVLSILTPLLLLIAQFYGTVAYPKELILIIMLTWMSAYLMAYTAALNHLKRGDQKKALDTLLAFFISLTIGFAMLPLFLQGAFQALFRKNAPFKVTPKGVDDEDASIWEIIKNNLFGILLGIYFLSFTPFIPVTYGYTIPGLIMGFSLILWPFHLKLKKGARAIKNKISSILHRGATKWQARFPLPPLEEKTPPSKKTLFFLVTLFSTFLIYIRFQNLNYLGPWMDEATYINAGRDVLNPDRDWGWINGSKYLFPSLAALGDSLYGSFVGARVVTAILGTFTLVFTFLYTRLVLNSFFPGEGRANILRSLLAVAAIGISVPLLFTSRLATYDTLAYFFFAIALYLIQRSEHSKSPLFLILATMALTLAIASKYVILIFIFFMISYVLFLRGDDGLWKKQFVYPLMLLVILFVGFNFSEILVGISLTGKGFWVNRSIGGVLFETFYLIGPYLFLILLGMLFVPKEKRGQALWLLGGASFIILYHIYDRHIQALIKGLSVFLIILAPIIGIALSRIYDLRLFPKKVANFLMILFISGALFYGTYQIPKKDRTNWEDAYGAVEAIEDHAAFVENPEIYTTRPHELVLLVPKLKDKVNIVRDFTHLPKKLKKYANTRYVVNGPDVILGVYNERYDIVHLSYEYWDAEDPNASKFVKGLRKALKQKGYQEVYLDDHSQLGRKTRFGKIQKPSYSHVLVHPRVLEGKKRGQKFRKKKKKSSQENSRSESRLETNSLAELDQNLQSLESSIRQLKTAQEMVRAVYSDDFKKELHASLEPWVQKGVWTPLDVEALLGRLRKMRREKATIYLKKALDYKKIQAFQHRLNQRASELSNKPRASKMQLVIQLQSEASNQTTVKVLTHLRFLIDRVEVLHQRFQKVTRSDWKNFRLSTALLDLKNPEKAIREIRGRGFGQDPSFSLGSDLKLPQEIVDELNSIFVALDEIQDARLRELAFTGAVLLLYELHKLTPRKRTELKDPDLLRNFVEQIPSLSPFSNWLGQNDKGHTSLLTTELNEYFAQSDVILAAA